jgi:ectoine hydroxylase-related dioxygenase (phytanoyl-CoA dioxygenase family)
MKISTDEIQQQHLNQDTLAEALRQVREIGFVVLEKTMSPQWTETMRTAWDGHIEGHTPGDLLDMPFIDPLAIENPWAVQILDATIGADFWAKLPYHCNSTAPHWPETQEIHRDQAHLFPDLPLALPPHMMVVHIPLVDFSDANGSTEVWPGTHLITDHAESYRPQDGGITGQLEERGKLMPSIRTNMPAGSTVVRDMRVWHRGMPNTTDQRRTMMSLVYHRYFPTLGYQYKACEPLADRVISQLSARAQHIFRFNMQEAHQ